MLTTALHGASLSSLEKKQRTALSATNGPIAQKPDIMFALIGCDAKEDATKAVFINGKIAAEYSLTFKDITQAIATLETHSLMPEKLHNISIEAPRDLLCALTAIMNEAYNQKQSKNTVSALKLSKKFFITEHMKDIDYKGHQKFFELIHMYNINYVVPDIVAIFALQSLDQKSEAFVRRLDALAISPFIKSVLAKQLYLLLRDTPTKYRWHELPHDQRFGTSVQDIHDNHICSDTALDYTPDDNNSTLDVSGKFIDDLVGLHSTVHTGKFQYLQIQCNQISIIPPHTFHDLAGVITLNLSSNHLKVITQHMFAGLSDLTELDISSNYIESIEQNAFVGTDIQTLCLDQNKITDIAPGAFAGLRSLRELRLSFNSISDLTSGVFTDLVSLEKLYLNGNPIADSNEKTRIEQEVKAASPHATIFW
jgi:hypothetical protein